MTTPALRLMTGVDVALLTDKRSVCSTTGRVYKKEEVHHAQLFQNTA